MQTIHLFVLCIVLFIVIATDAKYLVIANHIKLASEHSKPNSVLLERNEHSKQHHVSLIALGRFHACTKSKCYLLESCRLICLFFSFFFGH